MTSPPAEHEPYYRGDLALVHDLGFGAHAERCAPGILGLLEPVRRRRGLVLELACGTGLLTRHLVEAGHRVVATDASPAMLARAPGRSPTPRRSAGSCCRTIPCPGPTRWSRSATW